jgi:4-alpha-glucanotransferase
VPITRSALQGIGFDAGRIRWLSVPHARPGDVPGDPAERPRVLERCMDRVGMEELYTLKAELDREDRILEPGGEQALTAYLMRLHADRALLSRGEDSFAPAWYFWESSSFKSLSEEEQSRLRSLIDAARRESEAVWEERGRRLLTVMRDATDMLVCAEDLGDVPECVPRVLSELGILGLRVERWARDYVEEGAPFVPPAKYPRLSVATASVHDTSTLRGWWEESREERAAFFAHLGCPGECPPRMTVELLSGILSHLLGSASLVCVVQLQDLLDLDPANWSPDPAEDRINIPGTVSGHNWTWRMPMDIEELAARAEPAAAVRALSAARAKRSAS